jgi:uncharacterized protein YkwD
VIGVKLIVTLAILSGLLLGLFLWLRPVIGSLGTPTWPNVEGHASYPVADGTTGGLVTQGPPGSSIGPAVPRPGPADVARAGIDHSDEIERQILELVNIERANKRIGPLQPDGTLQTTAREHSDDMFVRSFFDHNDPDGFSPADRIAQAHRQLIGLTSENIWMGTNIDLSDKKRVAAAIMNSWMHSTEHRENILRKEYTNLGVGVAIKGQDVRATQNFAAAYAMTEQPVPLEVHVGDALNLTAHSVAAAPAPDKFDFFSSDKGTPLGGQRSIIGATVPGPAEVPAGIYKLRFIFPTGMTYWGPRIEVK